MNATFFLNLFTHYFVVSSPASQISWNNNNSIGFSLRLHNFKFFHCFFILIVIKKLNNPVFYTILTFLKLKDKTLSLLNGLENQ